ncbi:hypothetical protein HDE_10043 [Halotydeus destructor]|nr:hypothetical protein HDE_10043 [Halotydeus destructor]
MIKLLPFVALFIAAQAQLRTPTNNLLGQPQNRPSNVPAAPRPVFDNSGDDGSNEPAKPYEFSYDAPDGQGNTHSRSESFDGKTTRGFILVH